MFSFCPKCETGRLNSSGNCELCGYSLRVKCSDCGHLNIPGARFCGGCGKGMSLLVRFQSQINLHLNSFQKLKMRRFATGIAFGSLLTFFAFGSMGMQSNHEDGKIVSSYFQTHQFKFKADFAMQFEKDLVSLCHNRKKGKNAGSADLNQIIDLLIKHLKPVAQKLNKTRVPADSCLDYSRSIQNYSKSREATRGSSAMMLFSFLSDFLEFNYRDFAQESSYTDIPRFNFMCVPTNALKNLGIDLARSADDFGATDAISMEQLCDAAKTIIANAEIRVKNNS